MAKMLKAVGVKEKESELTDSPVEMSSDDSFVQVRSRKKKRSKRTHRSHRRSHARVQLLVHPPRQHLIIFIIILYHIYIHIHIHIYIHIHVHTDTYAYM